MANRQKTRGDIFERKAVALLVELSPPRLLVAKPQRILGAGRRDDIGDVTVYPDTAIQVKAVQNLSVAPWLAASGAAAQAINAGCRYHLGMVPIPRARPTSVSWLFTTTTWPVALRSDELLRTGMISTAVAHVRNDKAGIPRDRRVALVTSSRTTPYFVGTPQAWLAAYLQAHPSQLQFAI